MATDTLIPRSRRALLAASLGGLAATVSCALGRPGVVRAGVDGDVVLGQDNFTATTTTIYRSGDGIGLAAFGSVAGLNGYSSHGSGVSGETSTGIGARGESTSGGIGVHGQSDSGAGVDGLSTSGAGVHGVSTSGIGVDGSSSSSIGVQGVSGSFVGVVGVCNAVLGIGV